MVNIYEDKLEFKAMGCHMGAWLYADNLFAAEPLAFVKTHFLKEEERLTRFNLSSELMRLNGQPDRWVEVSDELWELVQTGLELMVQTEGCFDITLLDEIVAAGYSRSFGHLATQASSLGMGKVSHPRDGKVRGENILFHSEEQMIWLPAGTQLDLGGIAKGYTAQTARDFLKRFGPCLIDAGGDLTAGDGPGVWPGWPVGISAPWSAETGAQRSEVGRIWLANATLATSGIDYRRWQQGDRQAHHIIDPRTQQSAATDLLTVSIVHEDACVAEAWATAILVMGFDAGFQLLNQKQIPAVLIDQQFNVHVSDEMRPLFQPEIKSEQPKASFLAKP